MDTILLNLLLFPVNPQINPAIIPKFYGLAVRKGIFNVGKGTFQCIQFCYFFHIRNLQRIEGRNQLFFQFA